MLTRKATETRFLYFAATCALLTGFTTIAIHQIPVPYGSFEENLQLYQNRAYLGLNWLILFHCLLVLLSMLGVALVVEKRSRALAVLGLLCFCLFVFSEWERTLGNLWHLNGLRRNYLTTTDAEALRFLRYEMQYRLYQSNVHFLLFTLGFTLGNASYGTALLSGMGLDRWLGAGLLLWACFTSLAFANDFLPTQWMGNIVDACNKVYQPLIRLVVGYWLWQQARFLRVNV